MNTEQSRHDIGQAAGSIMSRRSTKAQDVEAQGTGPYLISFASQLEQSRVKPNTGNFPD